MMHKTIEHIEQISICWDFTAGYCPFGDEKCWFRHTVFPSTEVRCKICDDKFLTKSDYQKHKKQKHPELVPSIGVMKLQMEIFVNMEFIVGLNIRNMKSMK